MGAALPRIGVVVLNWNGLRHLQECLPSLVACPYPDRLLLVVDNGSQDGSAAWVAAAHPEVELLCLPRNLRFAGGNNAGARRVLEHGAQVVLLLNNDTRVDPGLLQALGEAFARDPELDIAGPRICYYERPDRIWYGGGIADFWLGTFRHRALRKSVLDGRDPAGPTQWVTGCALAVRAPRWAALGGLDESFYIYGEDVDLCLRAREAGARLAYVPAGLVLHKVSASAGGPVSAFKVYHRSRATWQLLRRHARPWHWPTLAPAALMREALTVVWLIARGHPSAARAQLDVWVDALRGRLRHAVAD